MRNKDFLRGLIYGIAFTIIFALLINTGNILFRQFVLKETNYETKAKAIYKLMKDEYVGEIDKDNMFEGIYTGMLYSTTDKYSRYISKKEYESFKISTNGNYVGIGVVCSINENNHMYIKAVYKDSGAYEAGLKNNDEILKIDGTDVDYENYSDAIDLIRGKENTNIKLTVYSPDTNKTREVNVTRKSISVPTVAHTVLQNDIGYIKISGFEGVTYDQYAAAYKDLKDKNIKYLIIDLRDNPGGLVDSVSKIADDIIPKGVITYTEDKKGKKEYIYSKEGELDIPLAVLVNGGSASASELLSGAIQDTNKGTIIGENTYGKGVVQTTYSMNDGSAVKITTAKYYTPKGVCIDGIGIKPDIEVKGNDNFEVPIITSENIECNEQNDMQLAKAVEVLKNK